MGDKYFSARKEIGHVIVIIIGKDSQSAAQRSTPPFFWCVRAPSCETEMIYVVEVSYSLQDSNMAV